MSKDKKPREPGIFIYIILPMIITLILVLIVFFAIDCMYMAGLTRVRRETIFYSADTLNYAGTVLALLGTVFLGSVALYQNRKMHEREKRRDNDITKRDTYALLETINVLMIDDIESLNSGNPENLILSQQLLDFPPSKLYPRRFRFFMKSSRDITLIVKAKITKLNFNIDGKDFLSNACYEREPYEINVSPIILQGNTLVDHTLDFAMDFEADEFFSKGYLPDTIKGIKLFISYINIFGVEVICEHNFDLFSYEYYLNTDGLNSVKRTVAIRYLPIEGTMNTIVKAVEMVE